MVASVVTVAGIAALAAGGLAVSDGYSHWTVPAVGPWAVAGGAIHTAGRAGVYDTLTTPMPAMGPSGSVLRSASASAAI